MVAVWWRRASTVTALVTALLAPAVPSVAAPAWDSAQCSATYFDGDARLGPAELPDRGPVGRQLVGYRRTGWESVRRFLATYYDPAANGGQGGWRYPPDNGYVIAPNGRPEEFTETLEPGRQIDRYGSEYGSFLAPRGLPYAERSIPPQSLDGTPAAGCDYHAYQVLKPFEVHAGPIAPWFAQPGWGEQFQLDDTLVPGAPVSMNVQWLVDNGYLSRLN